MNNYSAGQHQDGMQMQYEQLIHAHSTPDPDAPPPGPNPNPDDVPPPDQAPIQEPTQPAPPIKA
jgi:hypothetical protein